MAQVENQRKKISLVDGFIHRINDSLTQIIPLPLNKLCFVYFDIESIECLNDKRLKAKEAKDTHEAQELERLIVFEVCIRQCGSTYNREILSAILTQWTKQKQMEQFRSHIIESIHKCVQIDNVTVLRMMLKYCVSAQTQNEMVGFLNTAAKYAAYACVAVLFRGIGSVGWFDWTLIRRPVFLLNAVQYHHDKLHLIDLIMTQLERVKCLFVCDDVMKEVIRYDLVDVAKRIMDNRWYKLNEEDVSFAERMNFQCHALFNAKLNALQYYHESEMDEEIDWSEEWVGSEDGAFEDDNDWQYAVE